VEISRRRVFLCSKNSPKKWGGKLSPINRCNFFVVICRNIFLLSPLLVFPPKTGGNILLGTVNKMQEKNLLQFHLLMKKNPRQQFM